MQYGGGCSVHWGDTMIAVGRHLAVRWRIFSTVGGYHECGGGYSVHWGDTMNHDACGGIPRLLWGGIMSAVADIQYGGGISLSTVGDVQYGGGVI